MTFAGSCLAQTAANARKSKETSAPAQTGGANPKKSKEAPAPVTAAGLIWPLPPDPPRVRWVAEYRDMNKVNPVVKKTRWMDKLTGTRALDETLELRKPYGVAADRKGRIYVADTELRTVFVIDPKAKSVERREGSSRAPMAMPVGVALESDDRLFVSDAEGHSIVCFTPAGAAVANFGASTLGRPGGIAIDRQRHRLYVADAKDSRIAVFDTAAYKFVAHYGSPSKGGEREKGTFIGPTNVALDRAGNLYVADTGNYRIQVLDPSGKYLREFGKQGDAPGEFIRPKGVAVDSEGHVYVADAEFNNFQILTPQGQPLLAVGNLGSDPGQFALVAGLYIDGEDHIYTTEMFRGRVQVFQYIAQPEAGGGKGVETSGSR